MPTISPAEAAVIRRAIAQGWPMTPEKRAENERLLREYVESTNNRNRKPRKPRPPRRRAAQE